MFLKRLMALSKNNINFIISVSVLTFFIIFSLGYLTSTAGGRDAFQELARSFMQGRVDIPWLVSGVGDVADYQGKHYLPFGPFPSLIYIALGMISPAIVMVAIMLLTMILLYAIAREMHFSTNDSLWGVIAFSFASPLSQIFFRPSNAFISHAIVVACLLASYALYQRKRGYWIVGLLFAAILGTRATAVLCLLFFIADTVFVYYRKDTKKMLTALVQMIAPVITAFCILLWYNFVRFGDPLESGYAIANINDDLNAMRAVGLFSLAHIPSNLYYFLFAAPELITKGTTKLAQFPYIMSSAWGIGLIFSAPYFFSLLWKRSYDRENIALATAAVITAIPVFMYYGIGFIQTSYRYSLDFLPLLFIFFLRTIKATEGSMPLRFKILFLIVAVLNAYLFYVSTPVLFLAK